MQTLIKEDNYETESKSDLTPSIEELKKFVYSPYGDSETSESESGENNDYPISLEELEQEEIKTKRPSHQRPLTKLFMVALVLIPVFALIYLFIGGTKKPAQIARAIQESQTDKELLAQNQQLQEQLDQMQLELARLKQKRETPPAPKPKTPPAVKVAQPPAPKSQPKPVAPVRTVAVRKPAPPRRPVVRQTPPPPKPTAEDLMRRRQLLAQSMVLGGSIGESESEPVYESEIASIPQAMKVSYQQTDSNNRIARTEEIDFEITSPNSTAESINQNYQQFTPGTSISAKSLHPAFFSNSGATIVNMRVTDSNTPIPKGTNLSVELQEINGAVSVTSIQAQVDNQVWDLEASHWQVTAKDGMPLMPSYISEGNSGNGRPLRNTASNVLRNTRQVYRTDDPLTSTLIGVGSAIVDRELNQNNRRSQQGNQRSTIRAIEENTSIKLYVIQGFGI